MARYAPSGTTAATAEKATTPAPAPKPATAALPKPTASTAPKPAAPKPAATATAPRPAAPKPAPAKPAAQPSGAPLTTAYAQSYPEGMSASDFSYEDLGQSEEMNLPPESRADIVPYLEAVSRIAEMRRTAPLPSPFGPTGVAANPKSRATPLPPVTPSVMSIIGARPGPSDLDVPMRAAEKAMAVDEAYKAARAAYRAGEADIQAKQTDPEFPRSQFPELAKAQRERLQRVAELAAVRKEYGLTD